MSAKKQVVSVNRCSMAGCDRPVEHKRMQMCHRCVAWLRYWSNRPEKDLKKRAAQIDFWQTRIHSQLY